MVLEIGINIAATLELRNRFSPSRGIWRPTANISRYRPSRKEPNVDLRARPLGSVYTTANRVETGTVGLGVLVLDVTAGVAALAGGVIPAIGGTEGAGKGARVDGAA